MAANAPESVKLIATNSLARANYHLEETVEAGLVLTGTEVKSLRAQAPGLRDAYVEVRGTAGSLEAWLLNAHIAPYSHGNIWNHEPLRPRKLLLHRHQIERLHGGVHKDGLTVVPTKMYFKNGVAKIEIALARGKKKHDKRDDIRRRQAEREMSRAKKLKR
jgi:SsrA-binding protein